jgi:hypothetical protein
VSPPCVQAGVRIPCMECNRHFRGRACFTNHNLKDGNKKGVCDRQLVCPSRDALIELNRIHECGKHFCKTCKALKEKQHLCYMQPLKNVLPSGDAVLFVFFDFETTQDTQYSHTARLHVPNLVCLQQFCSRCDSSDNVDENCTLRGTRKHSF